VIFPHHHGTINPTLPLRDLRPWPDPITRRTLDPVTPDENDGATYGRNRLQRDRQDRVLGGVCAGIAEQLDVDPLLIRIAAVALALVSGGTAVFAYLIAWAIVPNGGNGPREIKDNASANSTVRDSWTAAGGEWRSLATGLRRPRPVSVPGTDTDAARQERSRTAAIDAAMTSLGDRLRDPDIRAGARRSAAGLSTAVGASVGALTSRTRRQAPPSPETGVPGAAARQDVPGEVPPSWPTS
jgi:phage shock protein PspC (stress-responsive transcriptional regulator)